VKFSSAPTIAPPRTESRGAAGVGWLKALKWSFFLALCTCVVYWPLREFDFINFDDPDYVTQNPWVRGGLNVKGVAWAFTSASAQNWHPITWLSHMSDAGIFGLYAGGHHLMSVFLHAINAMLLAVALWRMSGRLICSIVVGALFALHPLRVESVAWIAERKDVLSGFFFLLTLLAYAEYVLRQRRGYYWLALGMFALGLMSKPMLVTLPFVLLLIDFWPLNRATYSGESSSCREMILELRPLIFEKIPFMSLAVISSIITFVVQREGGAVVSFERISPILRIENAFISYVRYVAKTIWPTDLSVYYPYPAQYPMWEVAGAVVLVIAAGIIAIRQFRVRPWLFVGTFWFLGMLIPVIGLVQVGEQAMADRYSYLPSIGLLVVAVWGITELWEFKRFDARSLGLLAAVTVLGCFVTTRVQLSRWSNSQALFEQALRVAPGTLVRVKLANALLLQGRANEAIAEYQVALLHNPRFPGAQYNLGLALARLRRWSDAVQAYEAALRLDPDNADAHNNLAIALGEVHRYEEAVVHFKASLRLRPDDPGVLNNLGLSLAAQERFPEASECYAQAVKLKPHNPKAHYNWGVTLAQAGKLGDAVEHFNEVLLLEPMNPLAHNELGRALVEMEKYDLAIEQYRSAIFASPKFVGARVNLSLALAAIGRLDESIQTLRQALQLDSNDADAHNVLGFVFARQGRSSEAIPHYEQAIRVRPEFPAALNGLAWIRAADPNPAFRNGQEAVQLAEKACALTRHQAPAFLDALAAAYAETGNFTEAVKTAQAALQLSLNLNLPELTATITQHLKAYQANQPWRETPP
jgi:tetratricopeptide (TPR) repeat protein